MTISHFWPHLAILYLCLNLSANCWQEKALNEFINYYEPVFYDGVSHWEFPGHELTRLDGEAASIAKEVQTNPQYVENIDIRAFGRVFHLELNRSVNILSADAEIIVLGGKDTCVTEKLDAKAILSNLVEGRVLDEPKSFVHGVLIKGVFTGVIHLNNQTFFVEKASKYFRDRMPFDCVIFRQQDLNLTAMDCAMGPDGYKCEPIKLLHRRGPGTEQVLPLARRAGAEAKWFNHKTQAKTTCTLKVMADHLFTKHAGDSSPTNAVYEMVFHVQEADHIYRKTDFDQDGRADNIGFKITEVVVQSSTTCLENRAFIKPKLTSDQYLEIFSEYDFENYCVGIAFSGYTFPGRILGIAWMADADDSGYVGGICEPRLFSTQDQKALSFNSAVITMMLQGRRMPRGITAIAVAHELGHSFGSDHDPHPDDRCSPVDDQGGRYIMAAVAVKGDQPNNRFFSPCSVGNIKTVLRKKGTCFTALSKLLCAEEINDCDDDDTDICCSANWAELEAEEEPTEMLDLPGEIADLGNEKGKNTKDKRNKKRPRAEGEKKKPGEAAGRQPIKPDKNKKKPDKSQSKHTTDDEDIKTSPTYGDGHPIHHLGHVPESDCVAPDLPFTTEDTFSQPDNEVPECTEEDSNTAESQCDLLGQVPCECPELDTSCVVCCKEKDGKCSPIRRKDIPWWILRRPGDSCHHGVGKCDAHGRCGIEKNDPLERDKSGRGMETVGQMPIERPPGGIVVPVERRVNLERRSTRWSFLDGIQWFWNWLVWLVWVIVSVLFFLFIVLFVCFVCPAVAVGIWCLQQCTCWSSQSTLHDDDMIVLVDESERSFFKTVDLSTVDTSSGPVPDQSKSQLH